MPALRRFVSTLMLSLVSILAWAQRTDSYPTKPVRIITGGASTVHDIATRQLGQRLSERWGQPIVVENQPAAALTIGTGIAARASHDGYTLLMTDRSALAVAPSLYKSLSYDPVKDLTPITLAVRMPSVLVSHPSIPAVSLKEFIDYAGRQNQPLNFASAGVGTAGHVANELFRTVTGVPLVNVHYKGGAGSILALLSGEVKAGVSLVGNALTHVRAGKLRAYVVTGKARFAGAPEIPSAAELGFPALDTEFWIGMLAPARTPAPLLARLHREVVEVIQSPDYQAALLRVGAEAASTTPAAFADFIRTETVKWGKVVRDAGIKAE